VGNLARPYFPTASGTGNGPLSPPITQDPFNDGLQLDLVANKLSPCSGAGDNGTGCGLHRAPERHPDLRGQRSVYRNGQLLVHRRPGDGIDQDDMVVLALANAGGARQQGRERSGGLARGQHRAAGDRHAAALRELPAGAVHREHRAECLFRI
jgi:hypothetical protein